MALTTPTVEQISVFSGRPVSSYTDFIESAAAQATLMFHFSTCLSEMPTDPYEAQLALNGIMAMADTLYLSQPYDAINASPIVSQQIGSTSFTRATYGKFMERIKAGEDTGVYWYDLAVQRLGVCDLDSSSVGNSSWHMFESDLPRVVFESETEPNWILGPKDIDPPTETYTVSRG